MNSSRIQITHVINPSRFYYRDLSIEAEEIKHVTKIELEIAAEVQKNIPSFFQLQKFYEPKKNEIVAYYCKITKKWIRCEVDESIELNGENVVILWGIDYGQPFHTKSEHFNLFPLPKHFGSRRHYIQIGGISAMPSKIYFDHENSKPAKIWSDTWNERAVKIFKSCVENVSKIFFMPSKTVSHYEVRIGDLIFSGTESCDFESKLLEEDLAINVEAKDFLKFYCRLFTNHIERWNNNSRTGGVLKQTEGFLPKSFCVSKSDSEIFDKSKLYEDEQIALHQKVTEWQEKNAADLYDYDDESLVSYDIPRSGASLIRSRHRTSMMQLDEVDENANYAGVSAQKLREMLEELPKDQEEAVKKPHQRTRRLFVVPAGANVNTTSHDHHSDFDEGASDLTSYKFVSASEVGTVKQDLSAEVAHHNSVDSMMNMLKRQKM